MRENSVLYGDERYRF